MFGKRFRLFKLFGFEVHIDPSWLILAVLITWTLAIGYFPLHYENLSTSVYWWMGIVGALGLFASIIVHELSHSLVARRYGLPIKGITLFVFGGVAEMSEEPPSAKAELMMAIAGPITSILIGFGLFGLYRLALNMETSMVLQGILSFLFSINFILAGFNLMPAFPLDGGRVLRAILWAWKKNLRWATRVAAGVGSFFGILLILLGVMNILAANFIGGIWFFLIGMFIRYASQMSYQQVLMRKMLEGEKVRDFMKTDPVTVPPDISLETFVNDYVYKHHYKMFPVMNEHDLLGCIHIEQVKKVDRSEWGNRLVREVAAQCSEENTIDADTDAMKALSLMNRTKKSRLMVVENGRLVGILALKDMLTFFSLKLDLEEQQ